MAVDVGSKKDAVRRRKWESLNSRCIGTCALLCVLAACSREHYRESADEEVTQLVAEKSQDPRWALPAFSIAMDPRSRYYDPSNPDYPPMPPDDPVSNQWIQPAYVQKPDAEATGEGGEVRQTPKSLENPDWRETLREGIPSTSDGKLRLRLEDSMRLALRNSPGYQQQFETIYLSALDVSTERFRFDTQFLGGFTAAGRHKGQLTPGGESNTVTGDSAATLKRQFATAGEILVGFVNQIGWEFFGPTDGFTSSKLSLTFLQPLLRGAGSAVALEQLTIAERTLLANLRAFQRYRQGFYTQVAIGASGVSGPQRRGGFFGGTGLTGFSGQGSGGFGGVGDVTGFGRGGFGSGGGGGGSGGAGFAGGGAGTVGGFIGLLQQTQQIRNTRDSLNAQLRTLALLESNLEAGLIDIAQVDQFRQNIETERANLLQAENGLAAALETYSRSVMGLPPDVPIEPDDELIRPFQLIDPAMTAVESAVDEAIDQFGALAVEPEPERLRQELVQIVPLRARIAQQFRGMPEELRRLEEAAPARTRTMTEAEKKLFDGDRRRLAEDLEQLGSRFEATAGSLELLGAGLGPDTRRQTADGIVELLTDLSNIVGELSLIEARARLEAIVVEPIDLTPEVALEIARGARLDWMNNRAALVDTWRLIEFNANALQSDLTLRFDGELPTVGDENAFKFRAKAATLRAALQWDGPFTRLVERNNYRQQLIQYQQDRRQLIQFEDGVNQTLRQSLRNLTQLRVNLEIQRRAVSIAIRRVDQTREALNRPVPPTSPGQAPQALGPTSAQNLLYALSDLRNTQNNLMSVWLNYLGERMSLYRELGIMRLDDRGIWIDEPLDAALRVTKDEAPLPPDFPGQWLSDGGTVTEGATHSPIRPEGLSEEASPGKAAPIHQESEKDDGTRETEG